MKTPTCLQDIVKLINCSTEFTAEELAAEYAMDAALDAEYGISEENLGAHLDYLLESGAKFYYAAALDEALSLSKNYISGRI